MKEATDKKAGSGFPQTQISQISMSQAQANEAGVTGEGGMSERRESPESKLDQDQAKTTPGLKSYTFSQSLWRISQIRTDISQV